MNGAPSDREKEDPSRALAEAIERRNFVRAEYLARTLNRPQVEIQDLREKAFRQFVVEFRNPHGAIALAKAFNFTGEEVDQILGRILREPRQEEDEKGVPRRRFDMKTKRYLDLEEWVSQYFRSRKWQKK